MVAIFDPTPDQVLLWTADEHAPLKANLFDWLLNSYRMWYGCLELGSRLGKDCS